MKNKSFRAGTAIKGADAWQRIAFDDAKKKGGQPSELYRLKVPGGWLVAVGWGLGLGPLTFVPDAEHDWDPGGSIKD